MHPDCHLPHSVGFWPRYPSILLGLQPPEHQQRRNMGLFLEGGCRKRSKGRKSSKSICPLLPLRRVSAVRGFVASLTPQHLHFMKWGFAAEAQPSAQITISDSTSQALYLLSRLSERQTVLPQRNLLAQRARLHQQAQYLCLPKTPPLNIPEDRDRSQHTREETDQSGRRGAPPGAEISRSWGEKN